MNDLQFEKRMDGLAHDFQFNRVRFDACCVALGRECNEEQNQKIADFAKKMKNPKPTPFTIIVNIDGKEYRATNIEEWRTIDEMVRRLKGW